MNDKNVTTDTFSLEEEKFFQEQIKELVIARIWTLSDDVALSIGGEELKRDQLIKPVIPCLSRVLAMTTTHYCYYWSQPVIEKAKQKTVTTAIVF